MKNQEDVFLDNTVMSESERNSVLVEDKEELEESQEPREIIDNNNVVIKSDMVVIIGVTLLPEKNVNKDNQLKKEKVQNLDDFKGSDDPNEKYLKVKKVPLIFSLEKKEKKRITKEYVDFKSFENGLIKIYVVKIVNMKRKSVDDGDDNEEKIQKKLEKISIIDKFILVYGANFQKCEIFDDLGNCLGKDKLYNNYFKINILENDFFDYKEKLINIPQYVPQLQIICNFFQKFFCYFKKIKERVMIILKSVNVKSLFIYTLYNKLQMKNIKNVSAKITTEYINQITFKDCLDCIIFYSNDIEAKLNQLILDENISNVFQFKFDDTFKMLREFSITKEFEYIKNQFLSYFILEYDFNKLKSIYNKTNLDFAITILYKKLIFKIRDYFLNCYFFCCLEKIEIETLINGNKNKFIYYVCIECTCIVCVKCFKYHEAHSNHLFKSNLFENEDLTSKLIAQQKSAISKNIELEFKNKLGSKILKREFVMLLDFIKALVTDYFIKKLSPYKSADAFVNLKNKVINKEFIESFTSFFNKAGPSIKDEILTYGQDNDSTKLNVLKELNKDKLKILNRSLIEEVAVNISSYDKSSLKLNNGYIFDNDTNHDNMNSFLSHRYSPKMIFRDLFLTKKFNNNFLETYFFPKKIVKTLSKIENNGNDGIINLGIKRANLLAQKSLFKNREEHTNNENLNSKLNKKRQNLAEIEIKAFERELSILTKIIDELSILEDSENDFTKLDLLIVFLEDIITKIINFGSFITDQDLNTN